MNALYMRSLLISLMSHPMFEQHKMTLLDEITTHELYEFLSRTDLENIESEFNIIFITIGDQVFINKSVHAHNITHTHNHDIT